MSKSEMDSAIDYLSNEGHIYSTVDDVHFKEVRTIPAEQVDGYRFSRDLSLISCELCNLCLGHVFSS